MAAQKQPHGTIRAPYFTDEQLAHIFTYHRPEGDKPMRYELIRSQALDLALTFNGLAPESPEKSLAIRKLEEAVMWLNASIARYPVTPIFERQPEPPRDIPLLRDEAADLFGVVESALARIDERNGTYYLYYLSGMPDDHREALYSLMTLPDSWRSGEKPVYALETRARDLARELRATLARIHSTAPDYLTGPDDMTDWRREVEHTLSHIESYHGDSLTTTDTPVESGQ